MNTISQKKFNPRLLAVMLFFTISFPAIGQELIKEAAEELSDTSIIRRITRDSILIYTEETGMDSSRFILETGTLYPKSMYFYNLNVNDFEIFEKTVYLCGYTYVDDVRKAVFGYFKLNQFPYGDIHCYLLEECRELTKLDVYKTVEMQFMDEIHLVMTGTSTGERSDVLVDATRPINGHFWGNMYRSSDENENLDDVAVTKDYIVVSTRTEEYGIPLIYYWQFQKPLLIGQDIFSNPMERIRVSSPISKNPVLLEHTNDNKYASVYKVSGYMQMELTRLEAPNTIHDGMTIYGWLDGMRRPIDIKYNSASNVYDILCYDYYKNADFVYTIDMNIYHVTSDEWSGISTFGKGTKYPENEVWSIDPCGVYGTDFVASGSYLMFRMYKYHHNKWEVCPERFQYLYGLGTPVGGYVGEWDVTVLPVEPIYYKCPTIYDPISFQIKCEEY